MVDDLRIEINDLVSRIHHLSVDELVALEGTCRDLAESIYGEMSLRMHTRGRSSKRLIDAKGCTVSPMNLNRPG